jgi:hypothetical protein
MLRRVMQAATQRMNRMPSRHDRENLGIMKTKRIAALLAAGALLLTLASSAFATAESSFDWQKDGNGQGWPNATCTDSSASMLWVWTGENPTSLTINGNVQAGSWVEMNDNGKAAWHFTTAITANNYPPTTASVTYTGEAGVLTLSHCDGTQPTPTPSQPVQTESVPPTDSPTPAITDSPTPAITDSPTPSITDSPTPAITDSPTPAITDSPTPSITDSPTPSITDSPTPSASESQPVQTETLPTPTPTATPAATPTPTPSGSVQAETGTPKITPPSTDALGTTGSTGGNGLPMVLAAVSALLLAVLVATPARKRSRR